MEKKGLIVGIFLILILVLFSSFISASELRVTEEHPFLVNDSWIDASQLKVGDMLSTSDGKKVRITSVEDVVDNAGFEVYNLEAGKYHNFVVDSGDGARVVVHNSNKPWWNPFFDDPKSGSILNPFARQKSAPVVKSAATKPVPAKVPVPANAEEFISLSTDRFLTPTTETRVVLNEPWIAEMRAKLSSDNYALNSFNKLVSNYKVYTAAEFDVALGQALRQFLDSAAVSGSKEYVAILGRKSHSSPLYVYSKIKDELKQAGVVKEGTFIWGGDSKVVAAMKGQINRFTGKAFTPVDGAEFEIFLKNGKTKFVTFDDASYSGMELVNAFITPLDNSYQRLLAQGVKFDKPVELDIIVPFVTKSARESVENYARTSGIKINLRTSDVVPPAISNILNPAEMNSLSSRGITGVTYDKGAFVFQHKVADLQSLGEFEELYKISFNGYDLLSRQTTIYKLQNTPLYNLEQKFWDNAKQGIPPSIIRLLVFLSLLN